MDLWSSADYIGTFLYKLERRLRKAELTVKVLKYFFPLGWFPSTPIQFLFIRKAEAGQQKHITWTGRKKVTSERKRDKESERFEKKLRNKRNNRKKSEKEVDDKDRKEERKWRGEGKFNVVGGSTMWWEGLRWVWFAPHFSEGRP